MAGIFWPRPTRHTDTARFWEPRRGLLQEQIVAMPGKGAVPTRPVPQSYFTQKKGHLQGFVRSDIGRDDVSWHEPWLLSHWGHYLKVNSSRRLTPSIGVQGPMRGKRILPYKEPTGTVGDRAVERPIRDPREQNYSWMR